MTLVKYSDFDAMPTTFSSFLDRVFNETTNTTGVRRFRPNVDIIENDKSYEIQLAVPGMKKDEFVIDVNEGVLTISGERKFSNEKDNGKYRTVETQFGSFKRSFTLPDHVVAGKINAEYVDGILSLVIPKDEKKTLKTTIKVK